MTIFNRKSNLPENLQCAILPYTFIVGPHVFKFTIRDTEKRKYTCSLSVPVFGINYDTGSFALEKFIPKENLAIFCDRKEYSAG
jgi:hypothetical protein